MNQLRKEISARYGNGGYRCCIWVLVAAATVGGVTALLVYFFWRGGIT